MFGWNILLDPLLCHFDGEVFGIRFSREPLLGHGQIDVPLGGAGRLRDGCHSRPVAVLHLLGLEHTKLTYRFNGRDFRLTDVGGELLTEILT